MTSVDYFIPNTEASTSPRVITAYLHTHTPPAGLVVDPFCHAPDIVVEATKAGRCVIATSLNPLDVLRVRLAVTPLSARDLDAAVTRLADLPKLGVSLQEHVSRLYRTTCRRCHKTVIADYFIWEREQDVPKQVHYRCPVCADEGLYDCDESDGRVLREVQPRGLHYWYVLERIARQVDRGRKFVEKLLELYTPRNLYVLSDLVRKMDDLFAGLPVHDFLRWALLQCLELGSKLNPVPGEAMALHTALTPLPRFTERNIWQLFEDATRGLTQRPATSPVPLVANIKEVFLRDGEGPLVARAFVGHMSLRRLTREIPPGSVHLVLTQPPQTGRTRWALPYLWTGWLYGHAESSALWPLLRRHTSSWLWYLRAMRATLSALQKALTADGHIVFLAESRGSAYYEALALAAAGANLRLESALYHSCEPEVATKPFTGLRGDYRLTWAQGPSVPPWPMSPDTLRERISEVSIVEAEEVLEQRAEPLPFVRLHCAIWEALARRNLLQRVISTQDPDVQPNLVREQIKTALEKEIGRTFVQLWKDEQREECLWWLSQPSMNVSPLAERVEQAVCEIMEAVESIDTIELLDKVYARFPGVLTPDAEWVMACLKSYGQQLAQNRWALRKEDGLTQRALAHEVTLRALVNLGQRLGYEVRPAAQGFDLCWIQGEKVSFAFLLLDSVALSRVLDPKFAGEPDQAKFVIFSAARQSLLHFKLTRFPWLRGQLASVNWQFLYDAELPEWANRMTQARSQLPLIQNG